MTRPKRPRSYVMDELPPSSAIWILYNKDTGRALRQSVAPTKSACYAAGRTFLGLSSAKKIHALGFRAHKADLIVRIEPEVDDFDTLTSMF